MAPGRKPGAFLIHPLLQACQAHADDKEDNGVSNEQVTNQTNAARAGELETLGWDDFFAESFRPFAEPGFRPARVAVEHRGQYVLYGEAGEFQGEATGRFRHEAVNRSEYPAVGDWVATSSTATGQAAIHAVLPRRSAFVRADQGGRSDSRRPEGQVVAANIDYVFIVSALTAELNLRRLERYLTLAWESGAGPVVVLTKADLCPDVEARVLDVEAIAPGVPVHPLSSATGLGLEELSPYLGGHKTIALLGSSGVGKSTLINRLLGEERLRTNAVREDDRGRHTTTHRELLLLPQGALVIDTPGMRELQLWGGVEAVAGAFGDIEQAASGCRFADCRHEREPACAVRRAVEEGAVPSERLESFHKLRRELHYLDTKQDRFARNEDRRKWKAISKSVRAYTKRRGKD